MKIKPILWTSYKDKDGKHAVKFRVTHTENGKTERKYHPIEGIALTKSQWDKKLGRVKDHPNAQAFNLKIIELSNRIEKNIITDGTTEATMLLGDKTNFYWWVEQRLEMTKAKLSRFNWKKQNAVFNKLREFSPVLKIDAITTQFITSYETYLLKKNHINTVADNLIRIKVIINDAIAAGVIPPHKNAFKNYKIRTVKTKKPRLNLEQIDALRSLLISAWQQSSNNARNEGDGVQVAVDMFLFSFNCAGVRFGDLCRLKVSNITDDFTRLKYEPHKTRHSTGIKRNIKLTPEAIKIVKRNLSRFTEAELEKDPHIFPARVTWAPANATKAQIDAEDNSISARNAFYNKKLKTACEWAKIPGISFHTTRNSLVDLAVKKKVGTVAMRELLGHARLTTTEQYMKEFYTETADTAMDSIFETEPQPTPDKAGPGRKKLQKTA